MTLKIRKWHKPDTFSGAEIPWDIIDSAPVVYYAGELEKQSTEIEHLKSIVRMLLEDSSSKADEPLAIHVGQVFNLSGQAGGLAHLLEGLDPRRVRAIERSLLQLNTLRHEGAVLAMPEIFWAQ